MAVNTTIRKQTQQVQRATTRFNAPCHGAKLGIGRQRTIANRMADAHQLLPHDAPGTNGEMAHFGIAHLAVRETHRTTAGVDKGVGAGPHQPVHHGSGGHANSVVLPFVPVAPAIQNGQHHW